MMVEQVHGILNAKRALVLCPHTDDEYGCAGTIIRLLISGTEVLYIALSRCEESVPEGYPPDTLEKECRECTRTLGMKLQNVEVWPYPVRHFPAQRQEILQDFVRVNREYSPDLVFVPTSSDTHQDHKTVYEEGFRAFKHASLLGYELPQNLRSFENTAFIRLSKEDLNRKIAGLSCYRSQLFRAYSSPDFIKSLAMVRGVQCNAEFAEAFELIRLIM
jgi:LmbE family N-acetylglucosaminyl deacetylase